MLFILSTLYILNKNYIYIFLVVFSFYVFKYYSRHTDITVHVVKRKHYFQVFLKVVENVCTVSGCCVITCWLLDAVVTFSNFRRKRCRVPVCRHWGRERLHCSRKGVESMERFHFLVNLKSMNKNYFTIILP